MWYTFSFFHIVIYYYIRTLYMYDVTLTNANHLGGHLARYNFCSFCIIPLPPLSFFSIWEHKKTAAALSPQTYNSHNYWQIDWVTIAIFLLQYILYIYFCNSRSPWRHKQSRFHNRVFPLCWDISTLTQMRRLKKIQIFSIELYYQCIQGNVPF